MLKKARSTSPTIKKNKVLRWTWRKPKDKPKRPLSAYNIFFADVRQNLINDRLQVQSNGQGSPTNGGLGFGSLARTVAEKWKNLDPILKEPYEHKAKLERERYKIILARWEQKQADKAKQEEVQLLSVDDSLGLLEEDSLMLPSLATMNQPSKRFWQTEGLNPSSLEAYSMRRSQASHPTMPDDRPMAEWSLEPCVSAVTTNGLDRQTSARFDSTPESPSCDHYACEHGDSELDDTSSYTTSMEPLPLYETSCASFEPLPLCETSGASLEPLPPHATSGARFEPFPLHESPGASTATCSDEGGDQELLYYSCPVVHCSCPEDAPSPTSVDCLLSTFDQEEWTFWFADFQPDN
jgi:HMG-box domain